LLPYRLNERGAEGAFIVRGASLNAFTQVHRAVRASTEQLGHAPHEPLVMFFVDMYQMPTQPILL
jgi:hypothetical protein